VSEALGRNYTGPSSQQMNYDTFSLSLSLSLSLSGNAFSERRLLAHVGSPSPRAPPSSPLRHHCSPSAMWRASRRLPPPLLLRCLSSDAAASGAPWQRVAALWGNGDYGRLGLGALESRWSPTACPFFLSRAADPPASLSCGGAHTLFLTRTLPRSPPS
jgi:hypothetical protein